MSTDTPAKGTIMTNVLVLGASGQIASWAIPMLADQGVYLTLFARNASRITAVPEGATVIEGDVHDRAALAEAVRGQDVVYANLGGEVSKQAEALVTALETAGVKRLIFIVSLGIYHELPEEFDAWNQRMIADALVEHISAGGVIVVVDAEHMCMTMRGVRKRGSRTITSAVRGQLRNAATRAEAMSLILGR